MIIVHKIYKQEALIGTVPAVYNRQISVLFVEYSWKIIGLALYKNFRCQTSFHK